MGLHATAFEILGFSLGFRVFPGSCHIIPEAPAPAPAQVECFQQQVEPILYAAGVDMVYTGHTHAYEVC